MKIDRTKVKKVFDEYVEKYDISDPKIALKVAHTYRVSSLCQDIAESLKLDDEGVDLAWLLGMLHDIGRFEQCRIYNTFSDVDSVDHAGLACEILFDNNMIRQFVSDSSNDQIIYDAIFNHSAYRLPKELSPETKMYADLLRDADKIDIIRVQLDTPLRDIYNVTDEELRNAVVTGEVMDAFTDRHAVLRSLKKTAVDHVVGHISLTYELVYPRSIYLMKSQGYLDRLMDFRSDNPVTQKQFEYIRQYMNNYLESAT